MRHQDLRLYVIRPVLTSVGLYSEAAEELLVLTAATESHMGKYLAQVNGPALGIFQMEPATHNDLWSNYLDYRPAIAGKVVQFALSRSAEEMVFNLAYATIMARLQYFRSPKPLPVATDVQGLAEYWKLHYNTLDGKGTVAKALSDYYRLVTEQ